MKLLIPPSFKKMGALLGGSILLGGGWWRLWMYHGWFGPPHWVSSVLGLDGEASYQAMMLEMVIISFFLIAIGFFIFGLVRAKARKR